MEEGSTRKERIGEIITIKTGFVSSVPAMFFFIGIIILTFSSLTMSKIISMQNGIFILFTQELSKNGFGPALISTLYYLWNNLLWVVLVFLIFISVGFILFILFYSEINMKALVASQIIFLALTLILTNFSVILMIIALSLFIGILWERKTFEPAKNDFSTGYSLIVSRLQLMSILLCVGIFFVLYMNLQTYNQDISKSNKELMMSFMPDVNSLKEQQKKDVTDFTESYKNVLTESYNYNSEDVKTQCKPLYDGMMQSLDDYRNRSVQKIDQQEFVMSDEEISRNFPFFNIIGQITPVLIALSGFAFFTVLNPVMGVFGGILYSLIRKNKKA